VSVDRSLIDLTFISSSNDYFFADHSIASLDSLFKTASLDHLFALENQPLSHPSSHFALISLSLSPSLPLSPLGTTLSICTSLSLSSLLLSFDCLSNHKPIHKSLIHFVDLSETANPCSLLSCFHILIPRVSLNFKNISIS
jgi:hypothetical protein